MPLNYREQQQGLSQPMKSTLRHIESILRVSPISCEDDFVLAGLLMHNTWKHLVSEHDVALDKPLTIVINDVTITLEKFDSNEAAEKSTQEIHKGV